MHLNVHLITRHYFRVHSSKKYAERSITISKIILAYDTVLKYHKIL